MDVLVCAACFCHAARAASSIDRQAQALTFTRIEAARSGWDATSAPATGWVSVTLPDVWATRWPRFDGVVWYRLGALRHRLMRRFEQQGMACSWTRGHGAHRHDPSGDKSGAGLTPLVALAGRHGCIDSQPRA
ncbi:hypothetical protein E1956_17040 [Paraburkholderia pallida]|uniref:Uncharacterized protein n=1 Tax=Paraburkholderia pallida TaxID=2547399 RepID=A0A4V1AZE1_9BURK|nr:hypothetical protein E1956_17040 [Paraburkholderia pallida]